MKGQSKKLKALVLFGSQSDENIFGNLMAELDQAQVDAEFHVASAHRNPEKVRELCHSEYSVIIAGAGLAAHLPGVCASLSKRAVFGVPVNSRFSGLDAFLSIAQMPHGVSVISTGVDKTNRIATYLGGVQKGGTPKEVGVWWDPNLKDQDTGKIEKRLNDTANDRNIQIKTLENPPTQWNEVAFIDFSKESLPQNWTGQGISVPVALGGRGADPQEALKFFQWSQEGGLWAGVNQGGNALITLSQLRDLFQNS